MSDKRIDLETVLKLCHYWADKSYANTPGGPTPEEQLVGKAVQIMFPVVRAAFRYQQYMNGFENPVEDPHTQGVFLAKAMTASQEIQDQVKIMLDSLASGTLPSDK